ncbi:hypothetical protein ACWDKQ_35020 [Saccharopolyspora sp. NPDC000995]
MHNHRIFVRAVHKPSLLAKLAVLLNAHQVAELHYSSDREGASAEITVGRVGDE